MAGEITAPTIYTNRVFIKDPKPLPMLDAPKKKAEEAALTPEQIQAQ